VKSSSDSADPSLVGPSNETFVHVNGVSCRALLDSGSQVSTIAYGFYMTHFENVALQPLTNLLRVEGVGCTITIPWFY
jgi:hypothetical protein